MSISIDEAAEDFKKSIDAFVVAYKLKHAEKPEQYPLALADDNVGLWNEFISDFHINGRC